MTEPIGGECESVWTSGWEVNPAGAEGVCMVVQDIGMDLATPHGALAGSIEVAGSIFVGDREQKVAESIHKAWNRILARNMAFTEGTIRTMLSSVRGAVSELENASCEMALSSVNTMIEEYDGRVPDGLEP